MAHQSSGESALEGGGPSSSSTRRLIEDIASAIQRNHGIAVALSACAQAFDHYKREVHDSNIEAGAIISLLHALDHVTRKIRVSQSPLGSTNEAKTLMIAGAAGISGLEMITTRCSSEALEQCVRRNCNDLFSSLANLLTIFAAGDNQSSVVRHLLLKNTSNSLTAVVSRANLTETEIDLPVIKQCCSALIGRLQSEGPGPVQFNCVATLAHLSRTEKVRDAMNVSTGLLDTLVALIRSDATGTPRGTSIGTEAMSTLHNLSASRGNKMGRNEELQLFLIHLMTKSSSSLIISTAALILQNIFRFSEKPTLFCSEDELVNALLAGLHIEDGSGISCQMVCVGLLNHFLENNVVAAERISRSDLLLAVSTLTLENNPPSLQRQAMCTDAGELLTVLSHSLIFDESTSSDKVLNNLIDLSGPDSPNSLRLNASEALLNLSRIGENKEHFASHTNRPRLFSSLTSFALSGNTIMCENALETIYNLCDCTEGETCYFICRDNNVSSLLLEIISGTIEVSDVAYVDCVRAIKCLASHSPNQKRLAKYRSIVPTLIALAAKGSCSSETKEVAIEVIVLLSKTAILV